MRAWLIEGFHYDQWANLQWCEFAQSLESPRAVEVLEHISWAHAEWLRRVEHTSECYGDLPLAQRLQNLPDRWRRYLGSANLDRIVNYNRVDGTPMRRSVSAIARHVVDHGTYHRGQLREICSHQERDDFPETGMNQFFAKLHLHEGR